MSRPNLRRAAAVAGRFYPGEPDTLRRCVRDHLGPTERAEKTIALVGPHAGLVYSGDILGHTYAAVEVPETVVLLCPNHTGRGEPVSLWTDGPWETPLGPVPIDEALADRLAASGDFVPDRAAHLAEHAIEVHLPFARLRRPDVSIVPIVLARLDYATCHRLGDVLAAAIAEHDRSVLVAASTDMSHYVDAQTARRLDGLALERILALDPAGLHETVETHRISMCGYVPTTVTLVAALQMGARKATLIEYGNSGERSGDFDRVVGYAGLTLR